MYEKPELFNLSLAGSVIRGTSGSDSEPSNSDGKFSTTHEGGSGAGDGGNSSSTATAYEADE